MRPSCLSSDTDGAAIYYTLNGAKPAPFQTIGAAAKSTIMYQEPFVLPPGKRTIKALAVTRLDRSADVDIRLNIWMKALLEYLLSSCAVWFNWCFVQQYYLLTYFLSRVLS